MRDTMKGMNLPPPLFEQVQSGSGFSAVHVTLRNHIKQRKVWIDTDVSSVLGEALAKNLSSYEKRVLNFVAEHGKINVVQCHRITPLLAEWHAAKNYFSSSLIRVCWHESIAVPLSVMRDHITFCPPRSPTRINEVFALGRWLTKNLGGCSLFFPEGYYPPVS